jgi:hypothetical protein
MKGNVDLTEKGHFSDGWMQGGWMAKGVFRKRKPMETSQKFKDILKMGKDNKPHKILSLAAKLFGIKLSSITYNGAGLTFQDAQYANADWATATTSTTAVGTGGYWVTGN